MMATRDGFIGEKFDRIKKSISYHITPCLTFTRRVNVSIAGNRRIVETNSLVVVVAVVVAAFHKGRLSELDRPSGLNERNSHSDEEGQQETKVRLHDGIYNMIGSARCERM
jgi:hypothetical protein